MFLIPSTQNKAASGDVCGFNPLCVLGTDFLMICMNIAARKSQILKHVPRDCTKESKKMSTYFQTTFGHVWTSLLYC